VAAVKWEAAFAVEVAVPGLVAAVEMKVVGAQVALGGVRVKVTSVEQVEGAAAAV
jgi:hypothetical protein